MPRFAANLSFLFTELLFPERFAAAAAGFGGSRFLFPYAWPVEAIARLAPRRRRRQRAVQPAAGDWEVANAASPVCQGARPSFWTGSSALPGARPRHAPAATRW